MDWIESEELFHIMRDRPEQTNWPIFAGQWGTYLNGEYFRSNWTEAWKQAFKDPIIWAARDHYTLDQVFLERFVLIYIIKKD